MCRKPLALFVLTLGACSAGPSRPDEYRPTAVSIHARFASPDAVYAALQVLEVKPGGDCLGEAPALTRVQSLDTQLVASEGTFVLDGPYPGWELLGMWPLRFFRLAAIASGANGEYLSADGISPLDWVPMGFDLAYAYQDASWAPFGPAGQTFALPQGYSWLRRTCGAQPGQVQFEVRPIDEVAEFRPFAGIGLLNPQTWGRMTETWERMLVDNCGASPVTENLGTRISFDRAASLVWAPDGTDIDYLTLADSSDGAQLRRLQVATSTTTELTAAAVPSGRSLQIDVTGQIYVSAGNSLQRLVAAPGGAPTPVALPIPSDARVSPDGHWLAFGDRLWDAATGAEATRINGWFAGWSPDSRLAYDWSDQSSNALYVQSLVSPAIPPDIYQGTGGSLVWDAGQPLSATAALWSDQSLRGSCAAGAGLSLLDLRNGSARVVLDPSVGTVKVAETAPLSGYALAWATTCLGLFDTVCSSTLFRVSLPDGAARPVAVANQAYPLAVSPDNSRVAIASPSGIYVQTLPP
jgi:hypothetical protein